MYKQLLYILLFVAFCGKDVLCKKHKLKRGVDYRIIGGSNTTIQSHPYIAYLSLYDGQYNNSCAGIIVNKNFLLTAAHCLEGKQTIYVRIGSTYSQSGGTVYVTNEFYSHPWFNATSLDYDVAVIAVDDMDLDGENARIVSLIESGSDVPAGVQTTVVGWGDTTAVPLTPSPTLLEVTETTVDRNECNRLLGGITDRMFCAGGNEGEGHCKGDSGGPVLIEDEEEGYLLAGIVSFLRTVCGIANSPGVYTRVSEENIREFIRNITDLTI